MRRNFAGALIAAVALGATGAAAQTVSFDPDATAGDTITVTRTVPAGGTGDQTLDVNYAGDLDTGGKFIEVFVDGNRVGQLNGGTACTASFNEQIIVSDATYTAAAADGSVVLLFDASADVTAACGATPMTAFVGPFLAENGSPASFAVEGTLTAPAPPPAPPAAAAEVATAPAKTGTTPPATDNAPPPTDTTAQQETIASSRGALILQGGPSQSDRVGRLNGDAPATRALSFQGIPLFQDTPVALNVSRNALSFSGSGHAGGYNFWADAAVTGIFDSTSSGQVFGVLHMGVERKIGANTLLGFGAQIDHLGLTDRPSGDRFDGTGWMLGPLLTHRISPTLYLDGRLAYGRVDTDVQRSGGGTDSYTSDRFLAELAVIGQHAAGAYRIAPRAEFGYFRETSPAYTSVSLGAVAATQVEISRGVLGARVSRSLDLRGGTVTPYIDTSASYASVGTASARAGSYAAGLSGVQGRIALGASFQGKGGTNLSIEAGYGGIFTATETVSARLRLDLVF